MTTRRWMVVSLGVLLLPAVAALAAPATGRVKWQVTPPRAPRLNVLASVFENRRLPVLTAAVGQRKAWETMTEPYTNHPQVK